MNKTLFSFLLFVCISFYNSAQDIDLSHWKITIPQSRVDSDKPISVEPPEIKNFESNEVLKPFFYRDPIDNAMVFHTYPAQSTANSKYSRTEFREQMKPGSNKVNWTFEQGGRMRGTLSVPEVTQSSVGKYHRVIVMQIHGRLTDEQRDLIGEDDNNAPPMLKIYWDEGKVRVKTKILKNVKATDEELLHEKAWGNDKGRNFKEVVGTDKFTLEVNVSKGLMTITLNDKETFTYDGIDLERWGIFENYFKAGNYFQSRDEGSYAKVKYYDLVVDHPEGGSIYKNSGNGNEEATGITSYVGPFNPAAWKLELPTGYKAADWKLTNYRNDRFAKPFFFIDSLDESLVMKAYPAEGTSKAKYTRNFMRENNSSDWTMKKGGTLEATFQMVDMSKDETGKYHRTLLMQIDGKTSEKQTAKLGLEKAKGMPFLKVYWENERIRINRRILKDESVVGEALLSKKAWKESKGIYSREKISFEKAKIRVEVKKGRVSVFINDEKPVVFSDTSVSQWYFENYFSVGNYLQSKDENCSSTVKYFNIEVSHDKKK